MSYSGRLREANAVDWDAAVGHRFVDELLAGTVEDAVLAHYLVQDYRFCDAFVMMLGQACASAPDLESRLPFARQCGVFASDENTYFVDSFTALGVSEQDRLDAASTPATEDFDRVMRDAVESRSYAAVVAVLVVAEWLYLDWATRPDADAAVASRPEHVGWIDLHRGPKFEAWVTWLRGELDAHEPGTDADRRLVEDLFARAVRCERAFFDAALRPPGRP